MDIHHEHDAITRVKNLNAILKTGFLVMCVLNALLGLGLVYAYKTKTNTLTPPTLSRAFSVSHGTVDAAYLQMMGEYFLYLKLNVTPQNVTRQYGLLLDYVSPTSYPSVQPVLMLDAKNIKQGGVSSTFAPAPNRTEVNLEHLQFKQTGTLSKAVGKRPLEPEQVTYWVQMAYTNGTIELVGIKKED